MMTNNVGKGPQLFNSTRVQLKTGECVACVFIECQGCICRKKQNMPQSCTIRFPFDSGLGWRWSWTRVGVSEMLPLEMRQFPVCCSYLCNKRQNVLFSNNVLKAQRKTNEIIEFGAAIDADCAHCLKVAVLAFFILSTLLFIFLFFAAANSFFCTSKKV